MSLSTRHKSWHKEFLPTHSAKKKRKEKSQSTLWSKARVFDLVIKSDGRRAALKSRQSRIFAWKKERKKGKQNGQKRLIFMLVRSVLLLLFLPPLQPLLFWWLDPKNQLTFQSIFHVGSPCRVRVGKDNRFSYCSDEIFHFSMARTMNRYGTSHLSTLFKEKKTFL